MVEEVVVVRGAAVPLLQPRLRQAEYVQIMLYYGVYCLMKLHQ